MPTICRTRSRRIRRWSKNASTNRATAVMRVLIGADGQPQKAEILQVQRFSRLDRRRRNRHEVALRARQTRRRRRGDVVQRANQLCSRITFNLCTSIAWNLNSASSTWHQGDIVTRMVALFLLAMSLAVVDCHHCQALAITRKKLARNSNAFWHSMTSRRASGAWPAD